VDVADEDCFSVEFDANDHSIGDEAAEVRLVLELLVSDSTESHLEGLEITQRNLGTDAWLSAFIRSGKIAALQLYHCFIGARMLSCDHGCTRRWGGAMCGADGMLLTSRSTEISCQCMCTDCCLQPAGVPGFAAERCWQHDRTAHQETRNNPEYVRRCPACRNSNSTEPWTGALHAALLCC
jgi:hypothetical protein